MKEEINQMISDDEVIVSNDSHNEKIIINDSDCRDTFFEEVCDRLQDNGIELITTSQCQGINQDGCIVITLDQQYNSGSETIIYAPYDNTRLGNSEALAFAFQAAFQQQGLAVSNISCGKPGFRENEDGSVSEIIPTKTEEAIEESLDTSFVTVSLGTGADNAILVADAIVNSLARYFYYLDNYDCSTDLIYRADSGEDIKMIADYFHSSARELKEKNLLDGSESIITSAKTIINPHISEIPAFSKDYSFDFNNTNLQGKSK